MRRREFLTGLATLAAAPAFAGDADVSVLPAGVEPAACPGLTWSGAGPQAIEVFDYNCGFCRAAAPALDARVQKGALHLGLIDSPQLAIGSIQAAKVRQAIALSAGEQRAWAFHRALLRRRGEVDGAAALAAAADLGLDAAQITGVADGEEVRRRIVGAARFLNGAGVDATPAFFIGRRLLSGWSGAADFDAALKRRG